MANCVLIFITLVGSTSGFRFVCYYTSVSQYRLGKGTFRPESIDPFLCTHVVYSYGIVTGLSINPSESNDKTNSWFTGIYDGIGRLRKKNPQLKILLGIGSVNDTAQAFSRAIMNEASRNTFASNVAIYIRSIKFDGANLEWGNIAPQRTPNVDKNKFLLLVKALNEVFKTNLKKDVEAPLILSATLPARKVQIDTAYAIKELSEELDFISIRTLDLRTAEDKKVGLSAPLYSSPNAVGSDKYLSVKWVADYYVSLGVERDKMNIGIPTYGRSFQLKRENHTSIGSDAIGHGHPGPDTRSIGIIAYFELCNNLGVAGRVRNVPAQHGRYYVDDLQWVSYEDILSVLEKTCYARKERFGGMTFWTLELDDFSAESCRQNYYPLITTAVNVMKDTNASLCTKRLNPSVFVNVPEAPSNTTTTPEPVTKRVGQRRLVCYFTNWGQYRWGRAQYLPENIDPDLCTHIIYLFANVRDQKIATFAENDNSEPWREGLFARVVKLKKKSPQVKFLLSLGGPTADYAAFEAVANEAEKRKTFAKHVVSFLKERDFDGMELSWYQPTAEFKNHRFALIKDLRAAFDEEAECSGTPRLLLTLGMPAGKRRIDEGYGDTLPCLIHYVDFISLLTHNFHGNWDIFSGFNSPLYVGPNALGDNKYYSVDWVANYYASKGVAKEIINIGIPTFAITFTLDDSRYHLVGSPVRGTGKPGKYTGKPGLLAFYEVCEFIAAGAVVVNSTDQRVSYAVKEDQWVSFESIESVAEKACYAVTNGYGGVNVWSLDYDDFNGLSCGNDVYPLMTTIYWIILNNDRDKRCINVQPRHTEGVTDGTNFGTTLLTAHLLFPWLLVIVCVV